MPIVADRWENFWLNMNDIHTHQLGPVSAFSQGLLELLWTVYSEGRLQSFLRLRNFQNPFNKDKSVGL